MTTTAATTTANETTTGTVLCLVGLARAADVAGFEHEGLEPGQAAEVVESGDLAAVVVPVPFDYLAGDDAEQRLGDVAWVGPRAVAHDAIVRAVMARGPVVPSGFGSAFRSAASVRALIETNRGMLAATLEAFDGAVEFGVRVRANLNAAEIALLDELTRETPLPASPGARYLAEKKLRRRATEEASLWACQTAEAASVGLVEAARGAVGRPIRATDNDDLPTIAHWAFLVGLDREEAFREAVAAAFPDKTVFRVELTGPWPAFSFVPELGGVG